MRFQCRSVSKTRGPAVLNSSKSGKPLCVVEADVQLLLRSVPLLKSLRDKDRDRLAGQLEAEDFSSQVLPPGTPNQLIGPGTQIDLSAGGSLHELVGLTRSSCRSSSGRATPATRCTSSRRAKPRRTSTA